MGKKDLKKHSDGKSSTAIVKAAKLALTHKVLCKLYHTIRISELSRLCKFKTGQKIKHARCLLFNSAKIN